MISLSDQWTKIHNFKTNVKPGQKFQLSSQKLLFGNPDETTGVLSPLIYPQQTISYLVVKPKIEKIKITMGSIQLKIGNQIENFDVNLEKDEKQNSAQKYFIEILAPMIPKIYFIFSLSYIPENFILVRPEENNSKSKKLGLHIPLIT